MESTSAEARRYIEYRALSRQRLRTLRFKPAARLPSSRKLILEFCRLVWRSVSSAKHQSGRRPHQALEYRTTSQVFAQAKACGHVDNAAVEKQKQTGKDYNDTAESAMQLNPGPGTLNRRGVSLSRARFLSR
jgi:hypothetical protein